MTTQTDAPEADMLEILWIPLDKIEPHPHNVRHDTGDLSELTKSIEGQGIRLPLTLLPPDENGIYRLIDGWRRWSAGKKTKSKAPAPGIVRDLTEVEVLELMLTTGLSASDLTPIEEAAGYARLVELDATVASIAKKVGRSVSHVKGRLALMVLPPTVLARIEAKQITLDQAAALIEHAADADAMDHVDHLMAHTVGGYPNLLPLLDRYIADRDKNAAIQAEVEKLAKAGLARFNPGNHWWPPSFLRNVTEPHPVKVLGLATADARKHKDEPCHAVLLEPDCQNGDWRVVRTTMCTKPIRHTGEGPAKDRSELLIPGREGATPKAKAAPKSAWDLRREANTVAAEKRLVVAQRLARETGLLESPRLVQASLMNAIAESDALVQVLEFLGEMPATDDETAGSRYDAGWALYDAALADPTAWPKWIWAFLFIEAEGEALYDENTRFLVYLDHLVAHGYDLAPVDKEVIAQAAERAAAKEIPDVDAMELSDEAVQALQLFAANTDTQPDGPGGQDTLIGDSADLADLRLRKLVVNTDTPGLIRLSPLGRKVADVLDERAAAATTDDGEAA